MTLESHSTFGGSGKLKRKETPRKGTICGRIFAGDKKCENPATKLISEFDLHGIYSEKQFALCTKCYANLQFKKEVARQIREQNGFDEE